MPADRFICIDFSKWRIIAMPAIRILSVAEHILFVLANCRQPIAVGWDTALYTIIIPNSTEWQGFYFLEKRQSSGEIARCFELAELADRLEQCEKERFEHISGTNRPGRDAVNARIEEIEADMDAT